MAFNNYENSIEQRNNLESYLDECYITAYKIAKKECTLNSNSLLKKLNIITPKYFEYDNRVECLKHILPNTNLDKKDLCETKAIYVSDIVGSAARDDCFSKSYMPFVNPNSNSDFVKKWKLVLKNVDKWNNPLFPIEVIEYKGKYYPVEGNKRTSVAKYLNLITLNAKIYKLRNE